MVKKRLLVFMQMGNFFSECSVKRFPKKYELCGRDIPQGHDTKILRLSASFMTIRT